MSDDPELRLLLEAVDAKGEAYGLEVAAYLNASPIPLQTLSVPSALRRLEHEGLLASRETEPLAERGNRPRIYYRLTDRGRELLAQLRSATAPS